MKFQIGDRVCCVVGGAGDVPPAYPKAGQEGTVVSYMENQYLPYGVEFDEEFPGGHALWGEITSYRGWYCSADALVLVCQEEDLAVENLDWDGVL